MKSEDETQSLEISRCKVHVNFTILFFQLEGGDCVPVTERFSHLEEAFVVKKTGRENRSKEWSEKYRS